MKEKTKTEENIMSENKTINRGFLSLELIGVLIVIIIAIAGVLALISSAFSKNDVNNELTNINNIITNTRGLLKGSTGYDFSSAANMTGTLIEYGGVPTTMPIHGTISSGTATVTNVWGGEVTVQPVTISGTSNAGFSVTYNKVPQQACTTLATKLSSGSMVTQTTINGTAVTGEVPPSKAASSCTADTGGTGTNVMTFQSDS